MALTALSSVAHAQTAAPSAPNSPAPAPSYQPAPTTTVTPTAPQPSAPPYAPPPSAQPYQQGTAQPYAPAPGAQTYQQGTAQPYAPAPGAQPYSGGQPYQQPPYPGAQTYQQNGGQPYGGPPPNQPGAGPSYPPPGYGPPPDQSAAAAPQGPGVHVHDGFYLRMGIGLGGGSFAGSLTSSDSFSDGAGIEGKGLTIPVEFSIGGTLGAGFVLGVSSFGDATLGPHDTVKNYGQQIEGDAGSVIVSAIGPFFDYYFDPTGGLHAQGGFGYAAVSAQKGTGSPAIPGDDFAGSGYLATLGFGWETWIGEQWSAGILGRIQYGSASLTASSSTDKADVKFLLPTVLASFTYH